MAYWGDPATTFYKDPQISGYPPMTETRRRIVDAVRQTPGIHFNGLVRSLDLATGQVQHHVKRLLDEDAIVATDIYGRTHYYPSEFDESERRALALLRRETAREIVAAVFDSEEARPGEIAESLGLARSTLEWHLDHLQEQDLIAKRRDENNQVVLELVRPEWTIEVVKRADPSLLESMVSGYARLVDELLYE